MGTGIFNYHLPYKKSTYTIHGAGYEIHNVIWLLLCKPSSKYPRNKTKIQKETMKWKNLHKWNPRWYMFYSILQESLQDGPILAINGVIVPLHGLQKNG